MKRSRRLQCVLQLSTQALQAMNAAKGRLA
jgi:hypothetical protein